MNKGFTLIELMISISIILILMTFTFTTYSGFNRTVNKMDVDFFSNSMVNFINNSKQYSRINNCSTNITFDTENKKIYLSDNSKIVKRLYVPKGFKLNTVNTSRGKDKIYIDNRGVTTDACTIRYLDRMGGWHNISICVGSAYAEIKN